MEALAVQEPLDVAQQFEPVVAASDVKRRYGVNSICVKALPRRPRTTRRWSTDHGHSGIEALLGENLRG